MSKRENVLSRINISVMRRATLGTSPFSYSKSRSTFRTIATYAAATRAGLGSVAFVDLYKHALRRYRLIFKLCFQHEPTRI